VQVHPLSQIVSHFQ